MKIKIFIFFVLIICVCILHAQNENPVKLSLPEIKLFESEFPLYISKPRLTGKTADADSIVSGKITNEVIKYYFEFGGDSTESNFKVNDVYIKSLVISEQGHSYYIILLKAPASPLDARILISNNITGEYILPVIDYKIHAMYDYTEGSITESNLKKELKINGPDLELTDFDKDNMLDLKLVRLYHNGTSNAVETSIMKIVNNTLINIYYNVNEIK